MSDIDDRLEQITAISRVLMRMPTGQKSRPYVGVPAPILAGWATELHDDFGVRVHEDLAPKELVRIKSPMGNNGPVQSVTKGTPARVGDDNNPMVERMQSAREVLFDWLKQSNPDLYARYLRAKDDPTAYAILVNDITKEHPEVWEKGQEIMQRAMSEPADS